MVQRRASSVVLPLLVVWLAACGAASTTQRATLRRPANSTERAVRVHWDLAAEPERADEPEPHTVVTLQVDGIAHASWPLGRFRGSCWTSEQGFARGSSDALSAVQCVYAGTGSALSLLRTGPGALEVRSRNVDETAPNESAGTQTLLVLRVPEDAEVAVTQ